MNLTAAEFGGDPTVATVLTLIAAGMVCLGIGFLFGTFVLALLERLHDDE